VILAWAALRFTINAGHIETPLLIEEPTPGRRRGKLERGGLAAIGTWVTKKAAQLSLTLLMRNPAEMFYPRGTRLGFHATKVESECGAVAVG
jgi:hypothetical protein